VSWVLDFILAVSSMGAVVTYLAWRLAKRTGGVSAASSSEPMQHYGHPWPPVKELRKALPHPPNGFSWEIKVDIDALGDYIMHLAMVDVGQDLNVASSSVNLTLYAPHNTTWARYWGDYRSLGKGEFNRYITGPLVDWAYAEINKRHAGETVDYRMES
jgi:hypothetical protein